MNVQADRKLATATKALIRLERFCYETRAASERQLIHDTLKALAQIEQPQDTLAEAKDA